jgi:hypothetical protein
MYNRGVLPLRPFRGAAGGACSMIALKTAVFFFASYPATRETSAREEDCVRAKELVRGAAGGRVCDDVKEWRSA